MLKLVSITLPAERPPSLQMIRTIDCEKPVDHVKDWIIQVRGPAIVFVTKPNASGERNMIEIARSACSLTWAGDVADLDKIQKHDTLPLAWKRPQGEATAPAMPRRSQDDDIVDAVSTATTNLLANPAAKQPRDDEPKAAAQGGKR